MRSPIYARHRRKHKHRNHGEDEPGSPIPEPHVLFRSADEDPLPHRDFGVKSGSYIQSWLRTTERKNPPEQALGSKGTLPQALQRTQTQPWPVNVSKRARNEASQDYDSLPPSEAEPGHRFEKRARRKTHDDKYDYKPGDSRKRLTTQERIARELGKRRHADKPAREEPRNDHSCTTDFDTGISNNPTRRFLQARDAKHARRKREFDKEIRELSVFFSRDGIDEEVSSENRRTLASGDRLRSRISGKEFGSRSPDEQQRPSRLLPEERSLTNEEFWRERQQHQGFTSKPSKVRRNLTPEYQQRPRSQSSSCITWSTTHHSGHEKSRPYRNQSAKTLSQQCEPLQPWSRTGDLRQNTASLGSLRLEDTKNSGRRFVYEDSEVQTEPQRGRDFGTQTNDAISHDEGGVMSMYRPVAGQFNTQVDPREPLPRRHQNREPHCHLPSQRSASVYNPAPDRTCTKQEMEYLGQREDFWQSSLHAVPKASPQQRRFYEKGPVTRQNSLISVSRQYLPAEHSTHGSQNLSYGQHLPDQLRKSVLFDEAAKVYSRGSLSSTTYDLARRDVDVGLDRAQILLTRSGLRSPSNEDFIDRIEREAAIDSQRRWAQRPQFDGPDQPETTFTPSLMASGYSSATLLQAAAAPAARPEGVWSPFGQFRKDGDLSQQVPKIMYLPKPDFRGHDLECLGG